MIALAVYLIILVLFGFIFMPEREWDLMILTAWAFPIAIVGLLLVGLVLLTALTGNRFGLQYELNDEGAFLTVSDRRARAVSRLTLVIGAMVGSLSATGTGILTMAGDSGACPGMP